MFIAEPIIHFSAFERTAPFRAFDAVVALVSAGIVLLAVVTVLGASARTSRVAYPIAPGASNHMVGHVRFGR